MCLAILFLAFESQEKAFFNSLLSGAMKLLGLNSGNQKPYVRSLSRFSEHYTSDTESLPSLEQAISLTYVNWELLQCD